LQPNLFGDSFAFAERSAGPNGWLTSQHNEHRIVWAKATSLVETQLLKLPPGQSALFQNLVLILGCAGLWSWLCRRLLHRTDLCLITALAGGLLLLNPWQYENLSWEFQTPWFLINALVLLGALLLSVPTAGQWPQGLAAMGLPWVALTSTGQGLALALAFSASAWLHSRRLGVLVTASTALAGLTFFMLLPYSKPAGHPELSFQLDATDVLRDPQTALGGSPLGAVVSKQPINTTQLLPACKASQQRTIKRWHVVICDADD